MIGNDTPHADLAKVSVIIPTLNAAFDLGGAIAACSGVQEILVVDGGSRDGTADVARAMGARLVHTDAGRGIQMHAGAMRSEGEWLLFLHADTVLTGNWQKEVERFIADSANLSRAAIFRFGLDDPSAEAQRLERRVAWRTRCLGLPYGDQGLLIHRDFYRSLGGFRAWPLMEDVDLVRRIGRRRLTILDSVARTSAERWHRDGWRRRSLRNLTCLTLYLLGMPPSLIARLYG
ncbi:group 2 family glycosyl transferase [Hyphomicrobium denitrificans 1NES1]|uniref:Group 2 family glycosyl transferase n=1 Tax=Hyphomicrobium denitrificans 1NES1 TaxID=670307 RepID=N0BAJ5_9HYPH|nr:TIGR04283 family arsenosugar biosynthesis glycosyltransferase [Hyphomicrobium denitrificans]AGK57150.1 group 2 family glycosyl transferase [Hyphomicrobium denitrificans 1NES1]